MGFDSGYEENKRLILECSGRELESFKRFLHLVFMADNKKLKAIFELLPLSPHEIDDLKDVLRKLDI